MSAKSVEIEAIRVEAKKWTKISDEMSDVSTDIANLGLEFSAFLVPVFGIAAVGGAIDSTMMHSAYKRFHEQFKNLAGQAVTELDGMHKALHLIADAYEQNEDMTTKNFNDFYSD